MTAVQREVVLTFDNLGEAAALERRTWDGTVPLGRDPSVCEALPRLLGALDDHGLRATFFVEAINCEINPAAVQEIDRRDHELGVHGWRHEPWGELCAEEAASLLGQCRAAFSHLSLAPTAFRPPGGGLPAGAARLLGEYRWVSPERASVPPALNCVPFDWEFVDAYHLMDRFAGLRGGRPPSGPDAVTRHFLAALERPGRLTLVLHPFLMLDPAWWEGVQMILARLAALRDAGSAWVGPGREVSA